MTLRQKNTRSMSFLAVAVGLCFFFNPNLSVLDLLPDFIGCALVFLGLTRVARINPVMQEARGKFLKLLMVCAARDFLVLMALGSSAANEKATSLLLISFCASLLFLWFAFSAFRALFDGFYGLAVLNDCPPLFAEATYGKKGVKRSRTEIVLRRALVFLALREIINVLPELSSLSASSGEMNPNRINMYEYIGIMRVFAALAVLVLGVIYLVRILKYFRLLQKQGDFRAQLAAKEREVAARFPGNAVTRRYRLSFILMSIGAFLLTDFYIDFGNIVPDALAAVFLLSGVLLADVLSRKQKLLALAAAVAYAVLATLSSYFAESFYADFANAQIGHNALADRAYALMWGSALAEMLVFLGALVLLLLFLRRAVDKWGGYLAAEADSDFESRRREAFLEEFDGELIRTFIFGLVAALFSFVYDYMKVLPAIKWLRFLEFFWAFDFCASLLFGVLFATLLANILGAIKQRFMFD